MPPLSAIALRLFQEIGSRCFGYKPFYQGLMTQHGVNGLYQEKFSAAAQRALDGDRFANYGYEHTRYRMYICASFAQAVKKLGGDFLWGGVSFGTYARAAYDFLDMNDSSSKFFLVDPWEAVDGISSKYCTDVEDVRKNFVGCDNVVLVKGYVPDDIPSDRRFAFVHLNTGHVDPEVSALPKVIDSMLSGGVLVIDTYACLSGRHTSRYDEAASRLGYKFTCLPTGQGVLLK